MNLEDELTLTLTDQALNAPSADGLLAAVRVKNRQRARRRAATTAFATCAVLSASAVGVSALAAPDPVVLAWQNASTDFLAPVDLRPALPVTPGYLPAEVADVPRLSQERGTSHAEWQLDAAGRDGPLSGISITVHAAEPDSDEQAAYEKIDINGAAALTVTQYDSTTVTWQRQTSQWVTVTGYGPVAGAETLAVARSLTDAPLIGKAAFEVGLAPDGHVLAEYHPTGLTFGPADGIPNSQDDPRAVVVAVRRASSDLDSQGDPVLVGERQGRLYEANNRFDLVLHLTDDTRLQITTPTTGRWTVEEVARLATSVTYHGEAPRSEG